MAKILTQTINTTSATSACSPGDATELLAWAAALAPAIHLIPSRSLAEATALEAAFRAGRNGDGDGARAGAGR